VVDLTQAISSNTKPNTVLVIKNTSFSAIQTDNAVITTEGTVLLLIGPIIFTRIVSDAILIPLHSQTQLEGDIQFSYNQMIYSVQANYIIIEENTKLNITANNFSIFFFTINEYMNVFHDIDAISCIFQYVKTHKNSPLSKQFLQTQYKKYSILVQGNIGDSLLNKKFGISHCDWTDASAYSYSDPQKINDQIIMNHTSGS